jgi:hypothetical protein
MFCAHSVPSKESFHLNESGAVTVDWIVLTAAIVGIGIGAVVAVRTGTFALGQNVQGSLSSASVADIGFLGFGQESFVFSPFFYSDAAIQNYIQQSANHSDAALQWLYDDAVTRATAYINTQTNLTGPQGAGEAVDSAYIYQGALQARGLEPAAAGLSVSELSSQLREVLN